MKTQHRSSLADLAENIVKQSIGGFEMTYASFALDYTNRLTLSAADHVHVISAHLTHEASKANTLEDMAAGFWYVLGNATYVSGKPGRVHAHPAHVLREIRTPVQSIRRLTSSAGDISIPASFPLPECVHYDPCWYGDRDKLPLAWSARTPLPSKHLYPCGLCGHAGGSDTASLVAAQWSCPCPACISPAAGPRPMEHP